MSQATLTGTSVEVQPKRRIRRRKRWKNTGSQTVLVGPTAGKTLRKIQREENYRSEIEKFWLELNWVRRAYRAIALDHNDYVAFGYVMSIERYNGRGLPWYLEPYDWTDEGVEGCPDPKEYEFGYYGHDMQPGTTKFIIDRLEWAEGWLGEQLRATIEEYAEFRRIKAW